VASTLAQVSSSRHLLTGTNSVSPKYEEALEIWNEKKYHQKSNGTIQARKRQHNSENSFLQRTSLITTFDSKFGLLEGQTTAPV
jgi:hypothetical protein